MRRILLVVLVLVARSVAAQFIWVANAGEDTLSKIDINTNTEVARYRTWFGPSTQPGFVVHPSWVAGGGAPLTNSPWAGPAPSRIAVDSFGTAYVLDRWFYQPNNPNPPANVAFPATHLPVLLKIKFTGGTPGIDTSNSSIALPMADTNGDSHINCPLSASPACNAGGPNEITDKRIAWAVEVGDPGTSTTLGDRGALGRALCIDPSGNLWVGMYWTMRYYKVNSTTGQTIGSAIATPSHRPYSCVVDAKGKLWSVDEVHTLAEIDTTVATPTAVVHTHTGDNYSVSVMNSCKSASRVYMPEHGLQKTSMVYDPQAITPFSFPPVPVQFNSVALGIDSQSAILSAEYINTGRVIKYTPTGTLLWDTNTLPAGPTLPANDTHGLIIDAHDDIWAVQLDKDRVVKYSGIDGHILTPNGVPVGKAPYSYANVPPPSCPCAAVQSNDIACTGQSGNMATYSWSFTFTNNTPFLAPVTGITLSSSQVGNLTPTSSTFSPAVPQNGQATVNGTFTVTNPQPGAVVCLTVRLTFPDEWCCPAQQVCFRLPECRECAKLQGEWHCGPNGWQSLLAITNNGPTAAQSAQIFSTTPGVTVTPTNVTQSFPVSTPITVPLTISGAGPGQQITLVVNLHGPIDPKTGVYSWCCTSQITLYYPKQLCPHLPNSNGM
jgi:streptogramin lyase